MTTDASDLVASGYEAFYKAWGKSPTLRQIWREHVTGSDYPEEFAHISFLPLAVLSHQVGDNRLTGGRPPRALWGRSLL